MKKKKPLYVDEIRLVDILQTIIDKKISIVLIMFISILIGIGSNSFKNDTFKISLTIKPSKDTEFTNLLPIFNLTYDDDLNNFFEKQNDLEEKNRKNLTPIDRISIMMLVKFLDELLDYEEFISVLSNNVNIAESVKGLSLNKEKQNLFSYTKSLTLNKKIKDEYIYDLNFTWHDRDQGVVIINDLLKLVEINFKERIFNNLNKLLEIKRKYYNDQDLERIQFLKEQSLIAKELGIENNKIDAINLSQSNVSFNINTTNVSYYLRGFKAIDKEISLIENRQHVKIINLEKDIIDLKKTNINWAQYNTNYYNIGSLKKPRLNLLIPIGIGFVISIIYIFISIMYKSQKKS